MPDTTLHPDDVINPDYYRDASEWGPVADDIVVYDASLVGSFSDGYILMSNHEPFGLWSIDGHHLVAEPSRFRHTRGLWVAEQYINDDILEQRYFESPPASLNEPLTELSEN